MGNSSSRKIGYNIDKEKNCKDIIKYEAKMRERVREVYEREFVLIRLERKCNAF